MRRIWYSGLQNPRDLPFPSGTFVCVVVDCGGWLLAGSDVTALDNLFDVVVAAAPTDVAVLFGAPSTLFPPAPLMASVVALLPSLRIVVPADEDGVAATADAAALSLCSDPATPLAVFVVRVTLRMLAVESCEPLAGGEVAMEVLLVDVVELRITSMDWDFSRRFRVCSTKGDFVSPLLSELRLREA